MSGFLIARNLVSWSRKLRGSKSVTHLQCLALNAVRLVYEDIRPSAHGDLPGSFIKDYSLELFGIIDVDRLEERLGTAEDD